MASLLFFPPTYIAAGVALVLWPPLRENFWAGTAALGGLIALYGFFAKDDPDSTRTKVGDNCYFIGFVYTLAVVAISLDAAARFSRLNPDLPIDASALLNAVAIALSTSVVGMVLRFVVGYQFEEPPDELERLIKETAKQVEKVEAATGRLGDATARIADEVETVKDSLGGAARSARAWADEIDDAAREAGAYAEREAEKLLTAFGEKITDTLAQTHFDKIRADLQEAVAAHRDAVEKITDTLAGSLSRLDDATESGKEKSKALNVALVKIKTAVADDKWRAVGEAVAQFESLRESLQAIAAAAAADLARGQKIRASFDTLADGMRADIEAIGKIKADYRRVHEDAAKEALAETHKLYAQLIGGAQIALAGLDDLRNFAGDLRAVAKHIEREKNAAERQ